MKYLYAKYPDCKTWCVSDESGSIASKMTEENAKMIADALNSILGPKSEGTAVPSVETQPPENERLVAAEKRVGELADLVRAAFYDNHNVAFHETDSGLRLAAILESK